MANSDSLAFWFLVAALAVYRVSRMLAREEGPFGIYAEIRGRLDPDQRTWLGRGVNCPLCLSFWAGLAGALALGWLSVLNPVEFILTWLALSGAATWLYSLEK